MEVEHVTLGLLLCLFMGRRRRRHFERDHDEEQQKQQKPTICTRLEGTERKKLALRLEREFINIRERRRRKVTMPTKLGPRPSSDKSERRRAQSGRSWGIVSSSVEVMTVIVIEGGNHWGHESEIILRRI